MPPARDRGLSKGRLEVVLRATQSDRNNIPYITIKRELSKVGTDCPEVQILIPKKSL